MRFTLIAAFILLTSYTTFAQSLILEGTISGENNEPLMGVNVRVKNVPVGSTTDIDGRFSFEYAGAFPITIVVSSVGFITREVEVISPESSPLALSLVESILIGNEVVVSASRVEESILEAPVSIEKMNLLDIQNTASQDFYSGLINLKNVDMSTQSLTFKSLTLRGFNANGNTRIVQMVDGMDNQAPGLNFPVGNIVGISELDVESVELLPGASSALYGPNAINGIILINSKSPFEYQGLSISQKTAINHVKDERDRPAPYIETSLRYAKAFKDKLAFKISFSYLDAEDWYAGDSRDRSLDPDISRESPSYEGINVYGDEISTFLPLGINGENIEISRTGFTESDLVDYTARSLKFSSALHYRFNDHLEGILQANYGTGQAVYTGIDRYALNGFLLSQYKAELRGRDFTIKAYTTQENSGDSYAIGTLGLALNEGFSPSSEWFQNYAGAYSGALPDVEAYSHVAARGYADRLIPEPGSEAFENARKQIINTPLSEGGAKFLDKSDLYVVDGMYRLGDKIPFAEFIVGANFRVYQLNSEGTLFALDDNGDEYSISEYGGFVQVNKKLFAEQLKITASMRYDKNQNFDGRTTPRVATVWEFINGNFLRASYQTGFRMPTTQNQYIDLLTPQARLIGGLPLFRDRYGFDGNPVYSQEVFEQYVGTFLTAQSEALGNGQSQQEAFVTAASAAAPVLEGTEVGSTEFELEQNQTFEIGYKGLIAQKLFIDGYYYRSIFNNFSGSMNLFQSSTMREDPAGLLSPTVYQTTVSLDQAVKSQGAALGVTYIFAGSFNLSANYAWNKLIETEFPEGFQSQFNTPEKKINITLANRKLTDKFGFNATLRWQEDFYWESSFAEGEVPAYYALDVQMSYRLSGLKTVLKIGGSNITNKQYEQALGNPTVGALYYISVTYDGLLKN